MKATIIILFYLLSFTVHPCNARSSNFPGNVIPDNHYSDTTIEDWKKIAEKERLYAKMQKELADKYAREAMMQKQIAERNFMDAMKQKSLADINAQEVVKQKQLIEQKNLELMNQRKLAEMSSMEVHKLKQFSEYNRIIADSAILAAQQQKANANQMLQEVQECKMIYEQKIQNLTRELEELKKQLKSKK
jgi:hypothetical protein